MYAETLKECVEFDGFSVDLVSNAIGDLNSGKAAGFNGISNEFFIYGNSMVLVNVLHTMYNMMMKTGILPTGFNTALLTPIPKSKEISAPPVKKSLHRLINCCAKLWKLSFNPLKSSCYSIKPVDYEFILNGGNIP